VITESRKVESISVKSWNHVVKQEPQIHISNSHTTIETSTLASLSSSSGPGTSSEATTPTTTTTTSSPVFQEAEVVLLYTQVLQGELPVLNANVTATITLPGNPQHGPNTISVRLFDTGSGGKCSWKKEYEKKVYNKSCKVVPIHACCTFSHSTRLIFIADC
jgi:hypothetical protein